ncbi:hypothetical protein JAO76_12425 [Pontibacter sp. BT310]|uniref:Uncharacterized protein n=1 Tax=Pontibacter populi TaxID=890055 RepID=A0ABS6XD04_9BACT|nr:MULTISPECIES: hypothetical protein [Pontibacter]MBJ6119004.1 hypothetical protein [Pontibacter sp. BT310]MBR0571432.1 hypothetical protein [Microvirga sp. STS03]MBW3365858.1 hypothetical protein [Pontibacter populi]
MFSTSNKYFLLNLHKELGKLSEHESILAFNEKFKNQAFERIHKSYSETKYTERTSFYEDVLEHVGKFVVEELLIDIYLEDECDHIIERISERLSILKNQISKNAFLLGLMDSSSCSNFLKDELAKCIGVTEVDWHNTNQNSHPTIKKFAAGINAALINQEGELKLRSNLVHFIKYWTSLKSRRENRNDKAILLIYLINTFVNSHQDSICLDLKKVVEELRISRFSKLDSVPLLNLDTGESEIFPVGYHKLKRKLLEKLEQISFLRLALTPTEVLGFIKEYVNKHDEINSSAHYEGVKAKIIGELHRVDKLYILNTIGLGVLCQMYQKDDFMNNIIRRRYIIEVFE